MLLIVCFLLDLVISLVLVPILFIYTTLIHFALR